MLEYIKTEANRAYTENGALSYVTTYSDCLDLFATIGALRSAENQEIINRFQGAFAENPNLAMKWLAENAPASVRKNLPYIAEYGRWDDLLTLMGTTCEKDALNLIKDQLDKDYIAMDMGDEVSLLAKWLPSVNASSRQTVLQGKRIARALGMEDARYRKPLASLRGYIGILENSLREKEYTFDYAKQPSKAMLKYRKAFWRNNNLRYCDFLDRVAAGKETLHTGTLVPYDVVKPMFKGGRLVLF